MSYATSDPRARLASSAPSAPPERMAGAEYVRFAEHEATETDEHGKTWLMRGQNFVLAYSEVGDGWRSSREAQPDEFVLILPTRSTAAKIRAGADTATLDGFGLAVVPPGQSEISISGTGQVIQLFTTRAEDLAARAINAESYAQPHPAVAPFEPWPSSPSGDQIRTYTLDVPKTEGRFGRIFRCSTLMVNFLDPSDGPRDTSKMSPHAHDDFEQCSLAIEGDYRHHIRWPWTVDMANWREDDHEQCPAPSAAVIPPPAIHTSEATGPGVNQLIDIFCPPRRDFSAQPGWVLNADDYPLPD